MAFNESSLGFTEQEIVAAGGTPSTETAPIVEEIAASSAQVQEAARGSLDFLAALAMPLIYKYAFPPVFITIWSWLVSHIAKVRDFSQLALGLPRGFSKTTLMKLFILFCILFTQKRFILIICEVESKAINILSDVMDMLEEPNIKSVFGDWKLGCETDQQRLKKFGFRG